MIDPNENELVPTDAEQTREEVMNAMREDYTKPDVDVYEEREKEREALATEVQQNQNEDGSLKSDWERKDAKDFGVKENIEEAVGAVGTGLQNVWNNTVDLGKYLDPKYYAAQQGEPEEYEFASDWKFQGQVMPKTRWGQLLRDVTDFGVGMFGVGKIGMGIKGIRGLMLAGKTVDKAGKISNVAGKAALAKRLGVDAATGAVVDVWDTSMNSSEAITEDFIKSNPVLAENIFGLEDGRDLTPAQRAGLNMFEGMALGGAFGVLLEGAGGLYRKFKTIPNNKVTKPTKEISDSLSKVDSVIKEQEVTDYQRKTNRVERLARNKYEADTFKALKKSGALPEDFTMDQYRALKTLPNEKVRWEQLEELDRYALMENMAKSKNVDWGDMRDYSRFSTKQGQQVIDIGAEQLELDLNAGTPRPGAYYAADKTEYQNMPLSSGDPDTMKSVRDTIEIRTQLGSRRGSPRGVLTTQQQKRMATASGGALTMREIETLGKQLTENVDFEQLYKGKAKDEIVEDLVKMSDELAEFLGPQGRITDFTSQDLMDFIYAVDDGAADFYLANPEKGFQGIRGLTVGQLQMSDVVLTQMMKEMRDISRGSLSLDGIVDSRIPGGMGDELFDKFKAVQNYRMRTTSYISNRLRAMKSGEKVGKKAAEELANEASRKAEELANLAIDVIRQDETGGLFDAFRYFTAASNGSKLTMNDMADFFAKKFNGGQIGNKRERNKIVNELMTMGINSMLSGPKTPVRGIIGTGINSFARPATTIVGTVVGAGDRRTRMAAWAELGGMIDGMGEAWQKAVADYKTFFDRGGNLRDYTRNIGVDEFDAMHGWYQAKGTNGEKILFNNYRWMRSLNRNPLLAMGPRLLQATDTFFGQLIYRGTKRAEAFREVFDRTLEAGGAIGDREMKMAIREAEKRFNKKVWKANGQLSDDYANFKWKEAALTGEMPAWAEKVNQATEMMPAIKPFVGLFMRTGVNALSLMTKYTPGLNRTLQEVRDIMTLPAGHKDLVRYGITSADQLADARAVLKGREAIGFGAITMASTLWLSGNLSGNGPPDIKMRKSWEEQFGWQPRSIKIGNKWVSYESLEPFNSLLAFVADVGDVSGPMGEQWAEDRLAQAAYLMSANVANKTFLQGLMNLMDLLTGKGQSPEAIAANLVNNQVPLSSMRNEIGKVLSPGMRELEQTFGETIKNRNLWTEMFPGDDGDLPKRTDIFTGKPLRDWDPITRMLNAILPFNINTTGTQTQDLLMRSGVNLHQVFTTAPGGLDLKQHPKIISDFQFLMSQEGLEEKFTKLFQRPEIMNSIIKMEDDHANNRLDSPNATLHGDEIRRVFNAAKTNAWLRLKQDNPDIANLEQIEELKKLEQKARRSGRSETAAELDDAQKILEIKK